MCPTWQHGNVLCAANALSPLSAAMNDRPQNLHANDRCDSKCGQNNGWSACHIFCDALTANDKSSATPDQ